MAYQEPKREISEFNNAIGYLNHINSLFIEASIWSKNLDANNWSNTLWSLFRVLSAEMTTDEETYFLAAREEIKTQLFYLSRNRKAMIMNTIPEELYSRLDEFERRLRKIYKDTGLMNKQPEDAMKALK